MTSYAVVIEKAAANYFAYVRKRMLFRRLTSAEIDLPPWSNQLAIAEQLADVARARTAAEAQLAAINQLPAAFLRRAFNGRL